MPSKRERRMDVKLNSLKSEFLKYMMKSYAKDHERIFTFESFKSLYPELDDDFISDALFTLDEDGFVHVYKADDIAYETTLLPNAICSVEEDTLLRKGYSFIKEIRSWL